MNMQIQIKIGPCRIADEAGTHEPGDLVEHPSAALVQLAEDGTRDPESGRFYASNVTAPAPAPVAQVTPSTTTEAAN